MKQGWEIKKLGELFNLKAGKSISSDNIKSDGGEDMYPCFGGNGIRGYVDTYIADGEYPIIGRVGALCGNIQLTQGKFYATEHAIVAYIKNNIIIAQWATLALKSLNLRQFAKGVAQPVISASQLAELCILVPPLNVQERIVAELDCLSGVIEKKREQLKQLDALAQSIFYSIFGDPITNEKRWQVKKLGEVGKVITGNTPSTKDEENYSSNDYCFVKPSDIGKDYVTKIENTEFYISEKAFSQSRRLSKGSVLTTCIGIIGKVGILKVDATCNQQINAILPDENSISEYVAWAIYLTRSVLENIANAPVVPIINKGEFSNILIPLPPKVLQQEFAEKIEAIEKQKELIKKSIAETEELFNSRMDYYFN